MKHFEFILNYTDGRTETRLKLCKQYKRTKLYKQCIDMLESDILTSFSIYNVK